MGADYVHLEGHGAEADATITIENNAAPKTMHGVVVEADTNGNWSADVWGHKGETLQVTQSIGSDRSVSISFVIR